MVGFPHSEIIGSKLIRSSPTLIAAYYVLHRLCTPRHPLNALKTLDRSHYQCPQHQHHQSPLEGSATTSSGLSIRRITAAVLIGQIKLTRFHVASLFLPGVRVKRNKKPSLYDVERSGCCAPKRQNIQTCSLDLTRCVPWKVAVVRSLPWRLRRSANKQTRKATAFSCKGKKMVEPDGIEPTTSCLQSRRSPS
jgi:hypothetical protein